MATTKPLVLEIEVPLGIGRGAYVNDKTLTGFSDSEYEFLIKRGASFTIKEIQEDVSLGENQYYIKLVMNVD